MTAPVVEDGAVTSAAQSTAASRQQAEKPATSAGSGAAEAATVAADAIKMAKDAKARADRAAEETSTLKDQLATMRSELNRLKTAERGPFAEHPPPSSRPPSPPATKPSRLPPSPSPLAYFTHRKDDEQCNIRGGPSGRWRAPIDNEWRNFTSSAPSPAATRDAPSNLSFVYDAKAASRCLRRATEGEDLETLSRQALGGGFDISCLAASHVASPRRPPLQFAHVRACMLPCVRYWYDEWHDNVTRHRGYWSTRTTQGPAARHGPPSELLVGYHNAVTFGWAGGVFAVSGGTIEFPHGRDPRCCGRWAAMEFECGDQDAQAWRALEAARVAGVRISLYSNSDSMMPTAREILEHPALNGYFASSPNAHRFGTQHPQLHGAPRGVHNASAFEAALGAHGPLRALHERPRLLLCPYEHLAEMHTSPRLTPERIRATSLTMSWGREYKFAALLANGFECTSRITPHEAYYQAMMDAQIVWAPRGNGASEHKFFEAASAGAAILTDFEPNLVEALSGMRAIMLHLDAWQALTPSLLRLLVEALGETHPHQSGGVHDSMKAFWPYWMHRFHVEGVNRSTTSAGTPFAPPMVVDRAALHRLGAAAKPTRLADAMELRKHLHDYLATPDAGKFLPAGHVSQVGM